MKNNVLNKPHLKRINMKKTTLVVLIAQFCIYSAIGQNYLKGLAFMTYHQCDSAMVYFKKIENTDDFAKLKLGEIYIKQKQYSNAEITLKQIANKYSYANYLLFALNVESENWEQALDNLKTYLLSKDKIRKSDLLSDSIYGRLPRQVLAKIDLDNFYTEQEMFKERIKYLLSINEVEKCIVELAESNLNKHGSDYYFLYSQLLSYQGYKEKAYRMCSAIDKIATYEVGSYVSNLHFDNKEYEKALMQYEQLLQQYPDSAKLVLNIVKCNYRLGNKNASKKMLEEYCAAYYKDVDAYMMLANIYKDENKYNSALKIVNKVLQLEGGRSDFYYFRAQLYYETQLFEQAEKDLNMSLDLSPRNADAYYLRSFARIALNNKEGACFDLEKSRNYGNTDAQRNWNLYCN